MTKPTDVQKTQENIFNEIRKISHEIEGIQQWEIVKIYRSPRKLLLFQLLRGIVFGLGSVVGATLVVSIFVYLLSSIEFIPVIGDIGGDIIKEIQKNR